MAPLLNPIAELGWVDSGNIKTPDEASRLKGHHFFCPDFDCRDPQRRLFVKPSKLGTNFFSHHGNFSHDIRPETLLHKLAIKWFENKTQFEIPSFAGKRKRLKQQTINLDPDQTRLEYSRLKTIIPDVRLVTTTNFEFAIEIVVTNDVSDSKRKLIEQFNLPTLRIDLSRFYKSNSERCRTDKYFIERNLETLLTNIDLKKWIIFGEVDSITNELDVEEIPVKKEITPPSNNSGAGNQGCMIILPFIGILWLLGLLGGKN